MVLGFEVALADTALAEDRSLGTVLSGLAPLPPGGRGLGWTYDTYALSHHREAAAQHGVYEPAPLPNRRPHPNRLQPCGAVHTISRRPRRRSTAGSRGRRCRGPEPSSG